MSTTHKAGDAFVIGKSTYSWSGWVALKHVLSNTASITNETGLYRVRRIGRDDLDYIGQTGVGIRTRVKMLSGVYQEVMPYNDPHTAGPALWALREGAGCEFEIAALPVGGSGQWRRGIEAVAIAAYRQAHECSPNFNFGRLPSGYSGSSANTRRLVEAGKRIRGGPSDLPHPRHEPGVPPAGPLDGDPRSPNWCGHTWSAWSALTRYASASDDLGLYRIRGSAVSGLVYIGQGKIRDRLQAHWLKARSGSATAHPQHQVFAAAGELEYSSVARPWLSHQRLELETDLIAAHVLGLATVPRAQFLGG